MEAIEEIIKDFKNKLDVYNYEAVSLVVKERTDEDQSRIEIVKLFLNETIIETSNEKDIIGTTDLYEKWNKWVNGRYKYGSMEQMLTQITMKKFGNEVAKQYIRGKRKDPLNKTICGFIKIKYKSDESNVIEYMNKFTIKTNDKVLDRIPIEELYINYRRWDERIKIGPGQFHGIISKEYRLKQACKYVEVEKANGKTKIEKVGNKYDTNLCVMELKWVPGAKDRLKTNGGGGGSSPHDDSAYGAGGIRRLKV